MKKISILGSTGSIGTSALKVIEDHLDKFQVVGLAEGHDVNLLAEQIEKFRPKLVSVRDELSVKKLKDKIGTNPVEIVYGLAGAAQVATISETDIVLSAIVGAAGLLPTVEAIKHGKVIALANKETMVIAGELVNKLARESKSKILPVDSEHSAIFQSIEGHRREDISKIILTASGGPFLNHTKEQMAKVTVKDALKHPRWSMGAKITIDSATLMNKGLEVIEARWLFDMSPEYIDVVVHPQSIIHSMVEYKDGCVMAELGEPDMQAPIAYALSYPERINTKVKKLDLSKIGTLTFQKPDTDKFPALNLAYQVLREGGTSPVILNAANEVAVQAFLEEKISFNNISVVVSQTLEHLKITQSKDIETILETDKMARNTAWSMVEKVK